MKSPSGHFCRPSHGPDVYSGGRKTAMWVGFGTHPRGEDTETKRTADTPGRCPHPRHWCLLTPGELPGRVYLGARLTSAKASLAAAIV
jgi:hypothetical protein